MRVTKELVKPGRHAKNGVEFDITPADVTDIFEGIRSLAKANRNSPLILEHSPPGRKFGEGLPMTPEERAQAEAAGDLRNTVGWSIWDEAKLNTRGGIDAVFEVGDPEVAKKIDQGDLRFTSPEFRGKWESHPVDLGSRC